VLNLRLKVKRGDFAVLIGEAWRIRSAKTEISRIFKKMLSFAFQENTNCRPISNGAAEGKQNNR
jgi:hypothetical protein